MIGAKVWAWRNAPKYKNDLLAMYQKALKKRWIRNGEHLQWLTAQVIQENGALDPERLGDYDCSVGIPQKYVCSDKYPNYNGRSFLRDNPEWKDPQFQIDWLANSVLKKYQKYNGNIKQTIVHHNCPSCAEVNRDRYMCFYKDRDPYFRSLNGEYTIPECLEDGGRVSRYYEDEVASKVPLLVLE